MEKMQLRDTVQLLRVARFARMLDISTSKTYDLINSGQLKVVRLDGSCLRIPLEEVDRIKAEARVED
jgi:excisionase family DNA binding protein